MEQDKPEKQMASLPQKPKVYTYADLVDNETFRLVSRRLAELREKPGQLTAEEQAEFNEMYPAWFRHWYDPI